MPPASSTFFFPYKGCLLDVGDIWNRWSDIFGTKFSTGWMLPGDTNRLHSFQFGFRQIRMSHSSKQSCRVLQFIIEKDII